MPSAEPCASSLVPNEVLGSAAIVTLGVSYEGTLHDWLFAGKNVSDALRPFEVDASKNAFDAAFAAVHLVAPLSNMLPERSKTKTR